MSDSRTTSQKVEDMIDYASPIIDRWPKLYRYTLGETNYATDEGVIEHDIDLRVVRGVEPFDGLEEDIRARYDAWCESAEIISY